MCQVVAESNFFRIFALVTGSSLGATLVAYALRALVAVDLSSSGVLHTHAFQASLLGRLDLTRVATAVPALPPAVVALFAAFDRAVAAVAVAVGVDVGVGTSRTAAVACARSGHWRVRAGDVAVCGTARFEIGRARVAIVAARGTHAIAALLAGLARAPIDVAIATARRTVAIRAGIAALRAAAISRATGVDRCVAARRRAVVGRAGAGHQQTWIIGLAGGAAGGAIAGLIGLEHAIAAYGCTIGVFGGIGRARTATVARDSRADRLGNTMRVAVATDQYL